MLSFRSILEEIAKNISEDCSRSVITKEKLIFILINDFNLNNRTDALIFLENELPRIRNTTYVNDFAIRYNIYTDKIIFEKIFDGNKIERIVENAKFATRNMLRKRILGLSGKGFEYLLLVLYSCLPGYLDITITKTTGDGGIDFKGKFKNGINELQVYGQAKNLKSKLTSPKVRDFIGGVGIECRKIRFHRGIIICTGGFTSPAIKTIKKAPFPLEAIDLDKLVSILFENNIGINIKKSELCYIDENYWDEVDIFNY